MKRWNQNFRLVKTKTDANHPHYILLCVFPTSISFPGPEQPRRPQATRCAASTPAINTAQFRCYSSSTKCCWHHRVSELWIAEGLTVWWPWTLSVWNDTWIIVKLERQYVILRRGRDYSNFFSFALKTMATISGRSDAFWSEKRRVVISIHVGLQVKVIKYVGFFKRLTMAKPSAISFWLCLNESMNEAGRKFFLLRLNSGGPTSWGSFVSCDESSPIGYFWQR